MAQRTATWPCSGAMHVFAAFLLFSVAAEAQNLTEKCVTPNSLMGECVAIRNCPYVLNMFKKPLSSGIVDVLRRFQCGFQGSQPYVCCPDEFESLTETRDDYHPNIRLLPTESCGPTYGNAIVKGPQTHLYEYPWLALLGYTNENGSKFRCGGTIISERYILTAAHCVSKLPEGLKLTFVRIGEHFLDTDEDCEPEAEMEECAPPVQDYWIEETIPHPQFQNEAIQNDIGLVRLGRPINFTRESTKPICLPLDQKPLNLSRATMKTGGWGVTMEGHSSSELLTAGVNVVSTDLCADQYKRYTNIHNGTQICLTQNYSRQGLCVGDSGGPLMTIDARNGRTLQYGVMSFALRVCKVDQYPRVYTLVAPYTTWILDSIRD